MGSVLLQHQLERCWTTGYLTKIFHKSAMTILLWRRREQDPLPAVVIEGGRQSWVRFVPDEVTAWSTRNEIPMYAPKHGARKNPSTPRRRKAA